jgi:prevent-host-death family protein
MKTASIRKVQHDLKELLQWVDSGESIEVTNRGKPVARIVPVPEDSSQLRSVPDFAQIQQDLYGDKVFPDSMTVLNDLREERF